MVRVATAPPDGMNKTERAYAERLDMLLHAGEIRRWRFEAVRFVLGDRCTYTPDFEVVMPDGTVVYHEVKGFWRDDARVKIKAAARQFNDRRFIAVQKRPKKDGGGWSVEEIKP